MRISRQNDLLMVENVRDFDLNHIFDCGQCFRWERNPDGSYSGMAFGKAARIQYQGETQTLLLHHATEEDFEAIWRGYLDLDRDYSRIKAFLVKRDGVIGDAIAFGQGIRILNQEKWETLLSFIISQNNNIPRIKKCIETLARTLGEKQCEYEGKAYYSLPAPHVLAAATPEDLAPCKLGYRAKYLIETARQVASEGMQSLERLGDPEVSAEEALEALQGYCGVGPKVASCVALFAMGKTDSFPIDTWVKKVMCQLYGIEEHDMKAMAEFAAKTYGEYGGIAQQYLFYYVTHREVLS